MARNATLKALAKEDCFTSTSGQRHDVDMSAGTNHESARRGRVHEALRPLQACDNCPASPASLNVFVAQGTCNSDTPDPPVWLVLSVIRDNRAGPE